MSFSEARASALEAMGAAAAVSRPDCVSIPLSELQSGERRLDGEVYLSDGYLVRHFIRRCKCRVERIGFLADVWQPGRLKGVSVDPTDGEPYLAATQVFDIWPTPRRWLAPSKIPDCDKLYVEPNWILVTRSGTVGSAIITYGAHSNVIISDDLLRVEIDDPEMRSYVYTFLRTRFGRAMLVGSHYGNVIKHLEVSHLENVPVPILEELVQETHAKIDRVFSDRDEAYRLDRESRDLLADALSERPEAPREEGYSIRASEFFTGRRRLEAFAHSPEAQFVKEVYHRNARAVESLGSFANAFVPGRFKRIYGCEGTPYLDSEPIFKVNPDITKLLTPATSIDFTAYMVERDWILMACSGQIYGINGQAILATEWHEGKVVTQHIMRIIPKLDKVRPGYLQTVLSHPMLGQPLVVSKAYGTSVPELAPEDIERLPVPRLTRDVETQIADAAERASQLRTKADLLENKASRLLEQALEVALGIAYASDKGDKLTVLESADSAAGSLTQTA